jgi:hypothetical protein
MEIQFIFTKETAVYKEGIRRFLKKLLGYNEGLAQ